MKKTSITSIKKFIDNNLLSDEQFIKCYKYATKETKRRIQECYFMTGSYLDTKNMPSKQAERKSNTKNIDYINILSDIAKDPGATNTERIQAIGLLLSYQ